MSIARKRKKIIYNCKKIYKDTAAFSYIEILAALAIIAIFSLSVSLVTWKSITSARVARGKSQIETFKLALLQYYIDTSTYPTYEQALIALWEKPSIPPVPESWSGPYLSGKVDGQAPKDPWGNEYIYKRVESSTKGEPFVIICLGRDGVEGGTGADKDLES